MSTDNGTTDEFRVDTEWFDGTAVLTVAGDLDLSTVAVLQDAVDAVIGSELASLIIDLTGVDFLASAGMTVLVTSHQSVGDRPFSVVAHGAATARPLQLVGLDEAFAIHPTRDDALSAVGGSVGS